MAKKSTFSHVQAQSALEAVADSLTAENLPYELLRVFCGYGDASLRRVRDGRDNKSRDEDTILVKDKFVFRRASLSGEPLDTINLMLSDPRITRHNPRLYITVQGDTIIAWDPRDDEVYENRMSLLWKDFEFFKPLAGIERFRNVAEAEADVKTAELMAKIYDDICRYNDIKDPEVRHYINVFMSRLLFCFFAEDTGLFEANQFTKAIQEDTKADGSDLADFIDRIFVILSTDDKEIRDNQTNTVISSFPYVNGGLFSKRFPIPTLSRRARGLMIKCGGFEWGEINPDIFGSMTQAIVSPEDRAELGIHYTSVPNIMKVIQPLFLDDLTQEYIRCKNDIKGLNALLVRMGKIKFFDPACGSGNFLIISYKRVRELEIEIWKRLMVLRTSNLPIPEISLTQFYGIELDEYACDTATLSLWLVEHQMNNKFKEALGNCPNPLPLRPGGHIVCGNALRTDWNSVCPNDGTEEIYVMGNPPYLGSKLQSAAQKEDMVTALHELKDKKGLDYIAGWFWMGAKYIKGTKAKYAFVTTNSISQGEQVGMLWKPVLGQGLTISFARTSFKWSNNAKCNAAVFCEIIGVSNSFSGKRRYFNESTQTETRADNINPYLAVGENVIVEKTYKVPHGLPKAAFGCMPYDNGNLILSPEERDELVKDYPESSRLIKKLVGSQELLKGFARFCFWIDDEDLQEALSIPPVSKRIEATRRFRIRQGVMDLAERAHQFREHFQRESNAIIIPRVSSERREYIPMGIVGPDSVISDSAFAIYEDSGFASLTLLGILMSKMHNIWARAIGGKLKNDYRYSATLCYNTFPFPKLSEGQKDELGALAREILLTRAEHSEMTLGEMYNPESFPDKLRAAHHALDLAVERCYREKPFESDEERLEFLFKQYVKLTTDKSTLWKI